MIVQKEKSFIMNINTAKGLAFENYVFQYLFEIYDIKECYLWKNVPLQILNNLGIFQNTKKFVYRLNNSNILIDTGIDIICILLDGTYLLIQCKAYTSTVSQKHLSGFYRTLLDCNLLNKDKKIVGVIAYTSSLSEIITGSHSYTSGAIQGLYIPFPQYDNVKKKYIHLYISNNLIDFHINFASLVKYILLLLIAKIIMT